MSTRTELDLTLTPTMAPPDFLDSHGATRMPIEGDYVPLLIFNRNFDRETPELTLLEDGWIVLSIGRSFGFMRGRYEPYVYRSQLTNDVVIGQQGGKWCAGIETPQPLTVQDEQLFIDGIGRYIMYAQIRRQPHPTP